MILSSKQAEAVEQGKKENRLIVWWKPGEGKTRIAVAWAEEIRGKFLKEGGIWIAVLRRKAFWDLQNELEKTGVADHWEVEEFTTASTWKSGEWKLWMVSAGMLNKYETQLKKITKQKNVVRFTYVDELYMFGNPTSGRSKSLRKIIEDAGGSKLGVSGTIMPSEDNTAIFGQAKAMGIESYVARTLTDFRTRYQICRINDLQRYKIVRRINKPGSVKAITTRLSRFVNIHFPPPSREIKIQDIKVPLTAQQIKLIKQIKKDFWYEIDTNRETHMGLQCSNRNQLKQCEKRRDVQNGTIPHPLPSSGTSQLYETRTALEVAVRLRQITSGWLPTGDTYTGIQTNKLVALQESIDELVAAGEQVLVWVAFRRDIEIISSVLKVPWMQMVGGKAFDVATFKREQPKVVVATQGCGASVNHFKDFRYAIYYSYNYDWLSMEQSMGRIDRKDGTEGPRHYQFLTCEHPSIDSYVLENARQAGSTEQTFLTLFNKWQSIDR